MNNVQKHTLGLLGCLSMAVFIGCIIGSMMIAFDGPKLVDHRLVLLPYLGGFSLYLALRYLDQ